MAFTRLQRHFLSSRQQLSLLLLFIFASSLCFGLFHQTVSLDLAAKDSLVSPVAMEMEISEDGEDDSLELLFVSTDLTYALRLTHGFTNRITVTPFLPTITGATPRAPPVA